MAFGSLAARGPSLATTAVPQRRWGTAVPSPLSPLIGRRQELAAAIALLHRSSTRLLTLTGPGGIGKTRLALEIAAELEADVDDGVVWVSLEPVRDPDAVMTTVAASIGITGVAVGDRLVRALRESRLLLVLDNFEHVVEAAPQVAELLEACPALQILITSRSRLRIRGERVLPVPPLSLAASRAEGLSPDASQPPSPLTLHSEAVTLFMERAQALVPDIDVSEANAATVAEICLRLDGLPLAIELAAARVGHLPLHTLLQRMDQRLPLLVDGARDLPVRLQTMRNAIAWSYDLLSPDEQTLFRCLAVFDGGFTLEAANEVAEGTPSITHHPSPITQSPDTLDLIASLVDKSLVRHEPGAPGGPRYAMLETVREFAAERLAASGKTEAARQAHAAYFLALAEHEGLAGFFADGERRQDVLEDEQANMRVSLWWWVTSRQSEQLLAHVAALGGFWYIRLHLREGQEWLQRTLEEGDAAPSSARARALVWLALILFLRGDMQGAAECSREGLALCRTLGDTWSSANASSAKTAAPHGRSLRALTESLAHYVLGVATFHQGDPIGATACFDQGRAAAEAIANLHLSSVIVAKHTRSLGIVAGERGELDQASHLYGEALGRYQAVDHEPGIRRVLGDLAYLFLQRGNYAEALERYKEIFAQERDGPPSLTIHDDLLGAAIAAAFLHRSESAVHCLAATEALGERLGLDTSIPSERSAWDRAVAATRRALGEATFAQAWAAGRALRPEQAIVEVLTFPSAPSSAPGQVTLSEREMEVLRLLVAGQTDRAIGEALFISHRTVEYHVSRILTKLGVSKRSGAVATALAAGLVAPPSDHLRQA
jgi:predicted ATPase/DNA-binding CsgD family transcriptional regulator